MKAASCIVIAASVCAAWTVALAAPAYWYQWRSRADNARFCAQVSPGPAWERLPAPYTDAACRTPAEAPSRHPGR